MTILFILFEKVSGVKVLFRTSPKICGNLGSQVGGSDFFACNLFIFQYNTESRVQKGHPQ